MSTTAATVTFNVNMPLHANTDDVTNLVLPVIDLHNPVEAHSAVRVHTFTVAYRFRFTASNVNEAADVMRRVRVAVHSQFSADAFRIVTGTI